MSSAKDEVGVLTLSCNLNFVCGIYWSEISIDSIISSVPRL
jgi:hypothetical protein